MGSGAAEGTRTPDPIITNDVLYQLSYSGLHPARKGPGATLPLAGETGARKWPIHRLVNSGRE